MPTVEMASDSDWQSTLSAMDRYDIIDRLRKSIEAKEQSTSAIARKAAFEAETKAYNAAKSKEAYVTACTALITGVPEPVYRTHTRPSTPGIKIGAYSECHYLASGLVSEVYKSKAHALKVITETRNVEPHNPTREVKILKGLSHAAIIKLNGTFRDGEGRLVLDFPLLPLTLAEVMHSCSLSEDVTRACFHDLFSALAYLHGNGIIHRDIKPSNLLLGSPTGPAYLSDFGTAWHPVFSLEDEPAEHKILEVGTTCYRAPETLFGNRSYDTSLDMWAAGTMLVECLRKPSKPLFESRDTSEDGNQLGLILSMFKTLGTPTRVTWPEAAQFTTPPFEWYQSFPGNRWEELLLEVDNDASDLVSKLVCYESGDRLTALQALDHSFFSSAKASNILGIRSQY